MSSHDDNDVLSRLGLSTGQRVWVGGHCVEAKRAIEPFLTNTKRPPTGPIDVAFVTPDSPDESAYFIDKLKARLTDTATVWIVSADPSEAHDAQRVALDRTYSARPVTTS